MNVFLCWLDRWQALIAGLVGAAALIWTVRWTLLAERRRQEKENQALRTALGAEFRHYAGRTLDGCRRLIDMLLAVPEVLGGVPISSQQIENIARLPDAVVYPGTAGKLGTLGDHARNLIESKTLIRALAKREEITEAALIKEFLAAVLRPSVNPS